MSTPSKLYDSTLRTLAVAAGPPRERYPLPQESPIQFAAYAFDQEFEMLLWHPTTGAKIFPPAAKNTPSNAAVAGQPVFAGLLDANAILTKLSQPTPTGGGRGKFTGSFARVPAAWDDFKTQSVSFPGWINTGASGLYRPAFTANVKIREHYTYYVVDPTGILNGGTPPSGIISGSINDSGGTAIKIVPSMGMIPTAARTYWLNTFGGSPQVNSTVNDLVPAGGATLGVTTYLPTMPTLEGYQNMISNASTVVGSSASAAWTDSFPLKWDGITAPTTSGGSKFGQYQFADATVRVYEGQIIEVCTSWVIPQ